jgi:hypothetical protein
MAGAFPFLILFASPDGWWFHWPLLAHFSCATSTSLLEFLHCICRQFLRLKSLDIGCFSRTPNEMLRRLSKEVWLEDLQNIKCPALTDATVRKILFGCCRLTSFVIRDCELVTSKILTAYQESNSKARLIVEGCKGVLAERIPEGMWLFGKVAVKYKYIIVGRDYKLAPKDTQRTCNFRALVIPMEAWLDVLVVHHF